MIVNDCPGKKKKKKKSQIRLLLVHKVRVHETLQHGVFFFHQNLKALIILSSFLDSVVALSSPKNDTLNSMIAEGGTICVPLPATVSITGFITSTSGSVNRLAGCRYGTSNESLVVVSLLRLGNMIWDSNGVTPRSCRAIAVLRLALERGPN